MSGRFVDRTVLVTGAAGGQGAVEARRFAEEGAVVYAGDVVAPKEATVEGVISVDLDVTDASSWDAVVGRIEEERGHLDILVNNAGISRGTDVLGTSLDDWKAVLDVDLTGAFLGMKACVPAIRKTGRGGVIINTCSAVAFYGFYRAAYTAAKWGLRGLTKVAALEFAEWGIRVNAIHPGLVDSPMATESPLYEAIRGAVPVGRATTPHDIAGLVLYLCSDEAATITGSDYLIDGGLVTAGPMNAVAHQMGLWH